MANAIYAGGRHSRQKELADEILARLDNVSGPNDSGNYKAQCPFHEDRKPSLSFHPEKGYKCFSCNKKGGVRHLAQEMGITGVSITRSRPRASRVEQPHTQQGQPHKTRTQPSGTESAPDVTRLSADDAHRLLAARGLNARTIQHFGITFNEVRQAWRYGVVAGGKAQGLRWKNAHSHIKQKYYWDKSDSRRFQVYGLDNISQDDTTIYLAAGEPDTWILWQCSIPAVSFLSGEGTSKPEFFEIIRKYLPKVTTIFVVYDDDKSGRSGALKAVAVGRQCGFEVQARDLSVHNNDHKDGFDITDLYASLDYDDTRFRSAVTNLGPLEVPATSQETGNTADFDRNDIADSIEQHGLIATLAETILEEDHFAQDSAGNLFVYKDGVYRCDGERHIAKRMKAILTGWGRIKQWKSHLEKELANFIRTDAPHLWEQPPTEFINVQNGLLDVNTCELGPHTPTFYSPIQLPVKYDPQASCREWEKFVAGTFPLDAQDAAWEAAAYLITPDTSLQKALMLVGEGSNGKSTFLTGLTALVGKENISNLSLQKIEGDRFAASRLMGKLANICPDLPSTALQGSAIFKALTGGDRIVGEQKFKDSFDFLPFARLVFSSNQPPASADPTHAFYRRWVIVPFDRTFEGKQVISRHVLDAALADPYQLSGLLNKALAVLPRLRQDGFTESDSMLEAWNEFRQTGDPLAVWLDRNTIEEPDGYITKHALIQAFNRYNDNEGNAFMSSNAFGRAFKRLRPRVKEKQKTLNGRIEWVWGGIRFRSDSDRSFVASRDSRHSRDSSTCNEPISPMMDRGRDETNKSEGNGVNAVNDVNELPLSDAPLPLNGPVRPESGMRMEELL